MGNESEGKLGEFCVRSDAECPSLRVPAGWARHARAARRGGPFATDGRPLDRRRPTFPRLPRRLRRWPPSKQSHQRCPCRAARRRRPLRPRRFECARAVGHLEPLAQALRDRHRGRPPPIRPERAPLDHAAAARHHQVQGLRVTSPARTMLDTAQRLTPKQLTRAVNDLRLRDVLTIEQLRTSSSATPPTPRSRRCSRTSSSPRSEPTRSPLEDIFLPLLRKHGLPTPADQLRGRRRDRRLRIPDHALIVELDGWGSHRFKTAFLERPPPGLPHPARGRNPDRAAAA